MKKILKKLFGKYRTEDRVTYVLFGMKISRRRRVLAKRVRALQDEVALLKQLVYHSVHASSVPKASGYLRIVQQLCLEGMCEIDRICRKHGIAYWLDFGTLLGAVRHGGFIPWDDDVDICMMVDDYERFLELAPSELMDSSYSFHVVPSQIGKLLHKDFMPADEQEWVGFALFSLTEKLCFAVDVFPWHRAKTGEDDERLNERKKPYLERKRELVELRNYQSFVEADKIVKEANEALSGDGNLCHLGVEVLNPCQSRRVDDIFPLKEMLFEGKLFYVPNKTHKILTQHFGDYMQIRMTHSHLKFASLPRSEKDKLLGYLDN